MEADFKSFHKKGCVLSLIDLVLTQPKKGGALVKEQSFPRQVIQVIYRVQQEI